MTRTIAPEGGQRLREALTAPGWGPGETALIQDLEAMLAAPDGPGDLAALVARWAGRRGLRFDCPVTARSIAHLADVGAPPEADTDGPGLGAAVVLLGLAPALHRNPRNLVSGSYHLARLLDPHQEGVFSAVAAAVTAATFLGGRRDFVPDVLDVLIANDAPSALVNAVRKVPVREPSPGSDPEPAPPARSLIEVFRALHHLPAVGEAREAIDRLERDARRLGLALLAARPATGAG